jgi:hypothetical protein
MSMFKRTLSLALFVVFIGLCRAASANHVITADGQFQRYRLDGAEDSVVGYLKNGLPSSSTATIFERWELYGFVADKAGQLHGLHVMH